MKTLTTAIAHNNMNATSVELFNLQLFADGDPASVAAPPAGDPPAGAPPAATPPVTTPPAGSNTVPPTTPPASDPNSPLLTTPQVETTPPADVVPEVYADYTLPEGFAFDKAETDKFNGLAKEMGLSQEKAQKLVDYYAGTVQGAQQAQAQQQAAWTQEAIKTHGAEGIEEANRALANLATPEFTKFLKESGLSQHPEMIATFRKAYADHKEGSWVTNNSTNNSGVSAKVDYKALYPNSGY